MRLSFRNGVLGENLENFLAGTGICERLPYFITEEPAPDIRQSQKVLPFLTFRNQQQDHKVNRGMVASMELNPVARASEDSNCLGEIFKISMGQPHSTTHSRANLLLAALKGLQGFFPHSMSQNSLLFEMAHELFHDLDTSLGLQVEKDPLLVEQIS